MENCLQNQNWFLLVKNNGLIIYRKNRMIWDSSRINKKIKNSKNRQTNKI